ncbi:hypothetical protein [Rhabdothermincola sediminis]|uniref:hypothetical protein n=1 Tax=Rhabdothermincola sediminis TaxID=2751370 RepID=UPI001AA04415|nr:hypothetical protein [Rhabdothermincola sediminis]
MNREGPTEPSLLPALRPPQRLPEVGEAVERASRVVLGAVLLVGDGVAAALRSATAEQEGAAPPHGPSAWVAARRVAVGLAFETQRRVARVADTSAKVVLPTLGWLLGSPIAEPAVRRVADRLDRAYQAGLLEEQAARELAGRTGEATVEMAVPFMLSEVDLEPIVDQVLSELDLPALVQRVMAELDLDPIVKRVLADLDLPALVNEVVGELQLSSVVLEATGGITEDVVEQVRARTASADAVVERVVAKVLRRRVGAPSMAAFDDHEPPGDAGGASPR